jgi:chemotaxis protein methyltransferase CheR
MLLRRLTGIALGKDKAGLLAVRLSRRLAVTGSEDFAGYRSVLARDPNEAQHFVEAMLTHTTSFFREAPQYDWLIEEGFAELDRIGASGRLEIWSAACSTGQEGWTALMAAMLARRRTALTLEPHLLGTDLSRSALRTAAAAIYPRAQIEPVPEAVRRDALLVSREGPERVRISPELRRRARWRQANLVSGKRLDGISADLVFLRNVLIYFDGPTRDAVLDRVLGRLRPGGVLCVGHTEAGHVRRPDLAPIRPSIYRKVA